MNHNAWVEAFQRSRGFEKLRLHPCEGAEVEACGLRSCDTRSVPCASGAVRAAQFSNFSVCVSMHCRLLHFMRLADSKIVSPTTLGPTAFIDAQAQEQSAAAPAIKPKQRRSEPASSPQTPNVSADEPQSHPRAQAIPDVKSHSVHPEISLLQAALAAMGDLMIHCHGAFVPYDPVLRCFVLDPQLLVLPGNNRPSFTPKFIEDSRLNMRKQLLPADMYPFSEPMLQRQLLYVPDAAHEASIQRALNDVHAGSTVSSQNIIISSMFQSLYGCGSLIACGFWGEEHSSECTDAGYRGTFVLWAERQRMIPQHVCAAIDSVCHRFSETIFHSQKQSAQAMQDNISSSVASAAVSLASLRTSLNKRLVHIVQELLPRIFGSANGNSMLDTTYAFAVWIPTPQFLIDGFNEISELHLVASTVDGKLIQERMDRQKLENYPVLLQAWLGGGIVCIDGRGCFGCPDAVATIHRTRDLFGVPPELVLCETAIATSQQTGTDCVLAAVQIIGCQRAQGFTESELTALAQVAQILGGCVLQEQENVLKQQTQLKTNAMVSNLSSLLSATSLALGKVTFDAVNFCDIENLSLCEQNILKSFPLRSVRSQLKCMLAQVNARSAAFILVDVTESSVVLVLQVTAGAAFCSSDRQPKQCLLESRTGLVYRCIKTRKPVVYNLESSETLDARVDNLARDKFTTCLLVPIILENRVVAVVQVFSKLPSDSSRQGKVLIIETDAAKAVAPEVLSAAFQRSRAHMHMLRSGRADLMALERLPVLEALSSSEFGSAMSPNWRSEQGAPDFGAEDIEIATAASEACGQMVSLAFRAGHCVKVASNMSRFAHLIQIEDSGETLSKYACKVIVELLTASISPRLSCACFVFLFRPASKTVDSSLIETGSFCEGEELQSSLTAADVEIAKHVITKQMSDRSIVVCCPIHDSLVNNENSDESDAMGVMAVQMPESYQRMSEAEVDAMKVICQHLAEALKNSSALICTAKERANRQQHAAIDFLGNCIGCDNVDSMMMSVCKELNAFIHFDSVAAFTVKARNHNSSSALSIDREWAVSHFSDDSSRLSAQAGILRVLGTEVLTSASSIGPLVVDGLESAGNMFGHFQLARAVASTKVSVRPARLKKTLSGAPLRGCVFGIPISCLQDDGSLKLCGSVVFVRDGHDSELFCMKQSLVRL
jgi:hypothetical protein